MDQIHFPNCGGRMRNEGIVKTYGWKIVGKENVGVSQYPMMVRLSHNSVGS